MLTFARSRSALRIGFLTIVGALSFTALFFYSTNRVLGDEHATVFIRLDAADGLQSGDAVLHRGVKVGQVKAIAFADEDVVVRVRLRGIVPVSASARAALVAADLFGRQSIVLTDGGVASRPLAAGDTIVGTGPVSITTRIEQLGDQVGDLLSEQTIDQLRNTLHSAGSAATSAGDAASQIGSLARGAELLLGEQRQALGDLTREAGLLTRDIREVADPAELSALRDRIGTSAANLVTATATMDDAAAALARILAGLESGRGSAGMLLTDASLYEGVTGSLEALERLLDDVRENPKRYVTIKVF